MRQDCLGYVIYRAEEGEVGKGAGRGAGGSNKVKARHPIWARGFMSMAWASYPTTVSLVRHTTSNKSSINTVNGLAI